MIPLGAAQWTGSSNQILQVSSTAGVQGGSGSFSFGAWANLDTLASSQALLLKGSPNGYNLIEYGVFFNTGLGAFQASFSNGTTGATIASPVTLSTGTWYFVLVWYDASGPTINLAVNGTAATPVSWTDGPIAAGAHAVTLGYDATSSSYPFTGRIASAFLIQRVLTGPEKTYLYNSGNGRVSFDLPSFNGGSLVPPSGQGEWWDLDVSGSTRVGAFNGINMTPVDAGGPRTPTFSTSGIPRVLGLSLASLYTLMGPLSGIQGVASTNFTVTPDGLYGGTITPHTTGTGTFSPSTLSWSNTDDAKTFTYTPSSTTGSPHTVTTTSSPTLTDPAGVAYTVTSGTPVFLKVTAPSPIHGVPRVGAAVGSGGTVNIPVTGTYTGTPGGIEVTRDGVTWVTVADNSTGTLTGGVFAGVLPGVVRPAPASGPVLVGPEEDTGLCHRPGECPPGVSLAATYNSPGVSGGLCPPHPGAAPVSTRGWGAFRAPDGLGDRRRGGLAQRDPDGHPDRGHRGNVYLDLQRADHVCSRLQCGSVHGSNGPPSPFFDQRGQRHRGRVRGRPLHGHLRGNPRGGQPARDYGCGRFLDRARNSHRGDRGDAPGGGGGERRPGGHPGWGDLSIGRPPGGQQVHPRGGDCGRRAGGHRGGLLGGCGQSDRGRLPGGPLHGDLRQRAHQHVHTADAADSPLR
jgi:hypothetical protein